jgi:hypothetical protein
MPLANWLAAAWVKTIRVSGRRNISTTLASKWS